MIKNSYNIEHGVLVENNWKKDYLCFCPRCHRIAEIV